METPAQVVLKVILQNRRGTEEEWRRVNPIIEEAVIVYSTDVKKIKIGDGVSRWTDLEYQASDSSVVEGKTRYDFPSIGKTGVLYKASQEKKIYQWNSADRKYETIGDPDLSNIKVINCGCAAD